MPLTGEDIRARLSRFAAHWTLYSGSERSEAQTFLNELLACYGTDRREVASFEAQQEGCFLDMLWSRVCIIEMKAPAQAGRLSHHRKQALDYWRESGRRSDYGRAGAHTHRDGMDDRRSRATCHATLRLPARSRVCGMA